MLLIAALSYNAHKFTDQDLSIICCVNKECNSLLQYTLDRRLYANACKTRGDRYRKLIRLDESWNRLKSNFGEYYGNDRDPVALSLCNHFCSLLQQGDVIENVYMPKSSNSYYLAVSRVERIVATTSDDGYLYILKNLNGTFMSSYPSSIRIPPRTDIII